MKIVCYKCVQLHVCVYIRYTCLEQININSTKLIIIIRY